MHIPPLNVEIEQVYSQVLTSNLRSIAVTAANSGEGTTSIALALAQRCLLAGRSTLLVDLNLHHPSLEGLLDLNTTISSPRPLSPPRLVSAAGQSIVLTGIIAPSKREFALNLREPGVLEDCLERLKKNFNTVIFDTSAVNRVNANNIPAERVVAACDGGLLVVQAGQTTEAMISEAVARLNAVGAQLLGCVLNDRLNPHLQSELVRETKRLRPHFSGIADWLEAWLRRNSLLSMEV